MNSGASSPKVGQGTLTLLTTPAEVSHRWVKMVKKGQAPVSPSLKLVSNCYTVQNGKTLATQMALKYQEMVTKTKRSSEKNGMFRWL